MTALVDYPAFFAGAEWALSCPASPRAEVTEAMVEVLCFSIYGSITWPSMSGEAKASARRKWRAALIAELEAAWSAP